MIGTAGKRRLLNIQQAAKQLGIHRATLTEWMRGNRAPPHLTIGKRRYFSQEMLDQWLKARSLA